MTSSVHFLNETDRDVDPAPLVEAVRATLRLYGDEEAQGGSVTIVLAEDDRVRALNREFRGVDSVTDILSFPALPHGIDAEEAGPGDLVVALPWTFRQAQLAGHEPAQDLMLLMVHGTLHLLGHRHDTGRERSVMWAAQAQVLDALGLSAELVPALEKVPAMEATN